MKKIVLVTALYGASALFADPVKTYSHPMDPRLHPDDARRLVKPPDAKTFNNRLQFSNLRRMRESGYKGALDSHVVRDRLGDVVWPHIGMIYNKNVREQAEELKRRGLYMLGLWAFEPGSRPEVPDGVGQFKRPAGVTEMFEEVLGDHWFGMENGEQDGKYAGGWAAQMEPYGADRFQQYMNFQRHFERMEYLLGNKMTTLVSLNFGHYLLRECCYTLIGAETAQALPNAQVYYSFIRGAGKQYGVPWYGNVSIFTRWGWKDYSKDATPFDPKSGKDGGAGPDKGTSLALLKKLMYEQIFYNSVSVGFEGAFYQKGGQLSPVGRIQQSAMDWSARHGDPGVMHVPVALMVDFCSGWNFPRYLYSEPAVYKVWGSLPYEAGDYLTDGVLDMLYPGYQDSGYYADERGFNVDTPYGDIADCLLSDAPPWLLRQYAVLVLAGRIAPSEELRDTLRGYVAQGGWLVMTRGNAESLFPKGLPTGRVTVIPSPWGVADTPQCKLPVRSAWNKPLDKPYPLLPETRRILDGVFRGQQIFATSSEPATNGLSLVTCRRGKGDYTVCVMNNTWKPRPFKLVACAGRITAKEELATDVSERGQVGFAPWWVRNVVVGEDTDDTIAAGAVRIFRVKTDEGADVAEIPYRAPTPNAPRQTLFLRNIDGPIKEAVMRRPTFFRHYDSVMLDARYLISRDHADLVRQTDWLKKQGLKVMADASGLFNLFPDLRLVENDEGETARTAAAVGDLLDKMDALGARDLVIALHCSPGVYMTEKECQAQMEGVVRRLCRHAAEKGITVYLRQSPKRRTGKLDSLLDWVCERVKEPNFKPAPSLAAQMLQGGGDVQKTAKSIEEFDADLWFVAAPAKDVHGQLWSLHRPLAEQEILSDVYPLVDALKKKRVRLVYDAIYPDADAEYRDVRLFEKLETKGNVSVDFSSVVSEKGRAIPYLRGKISESAKFENLHPRFAKAFEFMRRPDLAELPGGNISSTPFKKAQVDFTRQRIFPGFDGKLCKIQPSIATDGEGTALLGFQKLLLTGMDVFYGQFLSKSTDGGKTWSEPVEQSALADTVENGCRAVRYATVRYSRAHGKWFALGMKQLYENDKVPFQKYIDGRPYGTPIYVSVDVEKGCFTDSKALEFPFEYEMALPFGQMLECENGDLLACFYYRPVGAGMKSRCVTVRYAFEKYGLRIVRAGTPVVRDDLARGVGEPSLARLGDKVYMTLRSDEMGLWCVSDDGGMTFSKPRPWTWTDGKLIGNKNTQQHWLECGGGLFLAYTREDSANGHVFRNRAPIYMAQFDPVCGALVRKTEFPLVPELGARLGNFCVDFTGSESWLVTAEWMQPPGCEKYGSDNSIWLIRAK